MKKSQTEYFANVTVNGKYETLIVTVSEETDDHIKINFSVENWRSKSETKKLLEEIIKQIDTLNEK